MKIITYLLLICSFVACKDNATGTKTITQKVTVSPSDFPNPNLKPTPAAEMLAKDPTIVVLDVRTPSEIAKGMVPNAMTIDYKAEGFENKINALDKDATYLIYCASGGRSGRTVSLMRNNGFEKSYNVGGYKKFNEAIATVNKTVQ